MRAWRPRHNAQFVIPGVVYLLVSLILVGCTATPSNSTARLRPILTSSSCDTPAEVQPCQQQKLISAIPADRLLP